MKKEHFAKEWKLMTIVATLLLLSVALGTVTACEYALSNVETPINVSLSMPAIPTLNENTEVTCTVSSVSDAPNTTARIILPDEVRLVSGDLTWQGDLKADESLSFSATVQFEESGNYAIEAVARRVIDEENSWGDIDVIYLNVGVDYGVLGWPSVGPLSEIEQIEKGDVEPVATPEELTAEEMLPDPPALSLNGVVEGTEEHNSITVTGTFKYWTILGDYRGGTPDTIVPAKKFLVQLLSDSGSHKAYGYTNSAGYFSISGVNPSGGIKARLWCYVKYAPNSYELRVVSTGNTLTGLTDVHHTVYTSTFDFPDDGKPHSIGTWTITQGDPNDGAWWIKDDLDRAFRSDPDPAEQPGPGTVRWSSTSTDGTYYVRGGQTHLKAVDERSPDTVIHEYGHNVMWNVYTNWNWPSYCPSPHYMNRKSHVNCAWSEGWANFFPLVVNGNPIYTWASGSTLNLETPTWGTPNWDDGDEVEGRVAGALWDIYDNANDGCDIYYLGFNEIWDTIYHQDDKTFAEYWSAWKARGHDKKVVESIYQNTINYNTKPNTPGIPSGPSTGYTGTSYSFSARTTDPEGQKVAYRFNWGDGTPISGWTAYVPSGSTASKSHTYSLTGTYYVKAQAKDLCTGATSSWSSDHKILVNPPITNPKPKIDGTPTYEKQIDLGEWATIKVWAKNEGEEANWQTISISSPEITDSSNIKIIGSDLDSYRVWNIGETMSASYGAGTVKLTYPAAEGTSTWHGGDRHYLQVKVKPEKVGKFTFYVKTVAGRQPDGKCVAWDPTSGTKDQQNEYVDVYEICVNGPWEDDPSNPCKERRLTCSGTYEYRNANEGEICDYGSWEDDPANPCKERRLIYKCSSGSCVADGYEYRNANEGEVCDYGSWEDDPANPCKERREIKKCSGGSCLGSGTYEYQNKADGTVCGYGSWEDDPANPCKERREIKKCSGGSCLGSGTYEYQNKADGSVCGYRSWEDDPSNTCKERREIKKCSGGSCLGSGTYEYRNKANGIVCGYGSWEDDPSNSCKERREIKKCSGGSCLGSGTYEYRNKADGTVCGYGSWEDDPSNSCKERREIKKCSGGSCVSSGSYEYRNKADGIVCGYGSWEDNPSNSCKERREIKKCSSGSCVSSGTYEHRNKADGTVCGYGSWEDDPLNTCKERREIKKCSGGSCVNSGTYEYRNKADGTACGYGSWEDDPSNTCKERREIKKCSGGSCVSSGSYEYRNKADGTVCGYGSWGDDPSNSCKERREIKKCSSGSCVSSGTYEYRNKADGTVCGYGSWEDDPSNTCKERREIKKCSGGSCLGSGTYEYRNKADGTACGYGSWEDDPSNTCKERREIKKCSGGSCVNSGTYEYRNKADGTVCGYGSWEDDPSNTCKERREILKCVSGTCTPSGEYEYQNKPDGTICGYGEWEADPVNPCKERREILKCVGETCSPSGEYEYQNKSDGTICGCRVNNTLKKCYEGICSDTGICNSTICGADSSCDGKKPGESCGTDRKCDSTCNCVEIIIFDTGAPANPYPSIMGTHNGTIKPNQTITVSKLYTYPCAGTGGHTEHVRIWNDTWSGKESYWKGYQDDWHNITFDEPFTLFAEKTYYYEIRTGSYPQIIHKPEHTTSDSSFINCTNFIDANGKEYTDWIPAIRLWS